MTTQINLGCAVVQIDENGKRLADVKRKYGSKVRIHDSGQVGFVLLTAESEDLSVVEVMGSGADAAPAALPRSLPAAIR